VNKIKNLPISDKLLSLALLIRTHSPDKTVSFSNFILFLLLNYPLGSFCIYFQCTAICLVQQGILILIIYPKFHSMKQLITALVLGLSITASLSANPVIADNKPAKPAIDKNNGDRDELVIVPNPKTGSALLSFKAEKASKGMVMVFNEAGNIVLKQPVKLAAGKNKINLSCFTNLEEGNYTVCLNTRHKIYSVPLLLWK